MSGVNVVKRIRPATPVARFSHPEHRQSKVKLNRATKPSNKKRLMTGIHCERTSDHALGVGKKAGMTRANSDRIGRNRVGDVSLSRKKIAKAPRA